jgi:hypothetical protein
MLYIQGLWEGSSAGTSVRGLDSQEGAIYVLLRIFNFLGYLQQFLVYLEKIIMSLGPQSSLVPHCKFFLEALYTPYFIMFKMEYNMYLKGMFAWEDCNFIFNLLI